MNIYIYNVDTISCGMFQVSGMPIKNPLISYDFGPGKGESTQICEGCLFVAGGVKKSCLARKCKCLLVILSHLLQVEFGSLYT